MGKVLAVLKYCVFALLLTVLTSCATYYKRNLQFSKAFEEGNLPKAQQILEKGSEKTVKGKNRLLFWLNEGTVESIQGKYAESNSTFEKAYFYTEDYAKNFGTEAASFIINAETGAYPGEDHEVLFIHYYKALNYLKMGQNEEALVECKRLTNKLNRLSDKYTSDNKYKEDAFINMLTGIIYEANADYNNAFISYRNAVASYENSYEKLFNLGVPQQLKEDVIRTAYLTGFADEGQRFEKKFNIKYKASDKRNTDVIFIWNNGLGPVKDELSVNLTLIPGTAGNLTIVNEELGISESFPLPTGQEKNFSLRYLRAAFPKYLERPLALTNATIEVNGITRNLDLAEDVNAISFKVLKERMAGEIAKSIGRLLAKQAAAMALEKENGGAGLLLGALGSIVEKADTRNWQTLPHSIYYTRISLPPGAQTINFDAQAKTGFQPQKVTFILDIKPGQQQFITQYSLDFVMPPRLAQMRQ